MLHFQLLLLSHFLHRVQLLLPSTTSDTKPEPRAKYVSPDEVCENLCLAPVILSICIHP